VHGSDRCAQLLVSESEKPSDASCHTIRYVKSQGLYQHHLCEVLSKQKATWLRLAEHPDHAIQVPMHSRPVGIVPNVHHARKETQ
jgi:hypothetical protein